MRIIPAIDLINGQAVRLRQGVFESKKTYAEDPVELAKKFENYGIEYLHVVDLDGAKSNGLINFSIVESICTITKLKVDIGGGVRTKEDVQRALDCGVCQVNVGSFAYQNPEIFVDWINCFGSDKLILSADCDNRSIAIDAWGTNTSLNVIDFIRQFVGKSLKYATVTDISKDGMLSGPAFDLYKDVLGNIEINLIASGGVTSIKDLLRLESIGCEGAIIGKAIYEGNIQLKELSGLC